MGPHPPTHLEEVKGAEPVFGALCLRPALLLCDFESALFPFLGLSFLGWKTISLSSIMAKPLLPPHLHTKFFRICMCPGQLPTLPHQALLSFLWGLSAESRIQTESVGPAPKNVNE